MDLLVQSIIRPKRRIDPRSRLFCFHYAGVGPSAFRGWADDLAADAEVCLVQLPGREGRLREAPFSSIADLLPMLIENMLPLLDRPFAFYGHSLGAMIAFESAVALRRNLQIQPTHFFAGASPAPHLPWKHPAIRSLPEDDFFGEIERRYGALPREVLSDAQMRALVLPILRADITMIETYKYSPEPPLDCDITVFGGVLDQMVKPSELDAWREHTSGRFRMEMLEGNHLFLKSCRTQLLQRVAAELNLCSENAKPSSGISETRT